MIELESIEQLDEHLANDATMEGVVVQNLDLTQRRDAVLAHNLTGTVLLGCRLDDELRAHAMASRALVFPNLDDRPFEPYRGQLYRVADLYDRFDRDRPESYGECLDARVYEHWKRSGRGQPPSIVETLARRLHDHAMTDALEELLAGRRVVAIMGGHGMKRSRGAYADVARIARTLTREGFLMASGGGPGAMEATHVGAWFASRDEAEMLAAIDILALAPKYDDADWLTRAFEVRERYDHAAINQAQHHSLGIPTWLYGHEPPNAFATHIAKYFANSVREDGLLAIATYGVVFSPGSAGTIQEIFQDACQNHYSTVGVVSPMVFLDTTYWTETKPIYPLLKQLAQGHEYADWLSITDNPQQAVAAILQYAASNSGASA